MRFGTVSHLFFFLVTFAAQFSSTSAWGNLGHETIAYIAQNFVNSSTESYCQGILGDTSSSYLANVSTWADSYKYTSEGAFSYHYHFIDAHDDPPSSCNVNYSRDCGNSGCSISAIQNYTSQLLDKKISASESLNALKFIVHIIGDIHQPLHDENWEVGGNKVNVTYNGDKTNLHHIWDTNMLEDDAGGYSLSVAESWASTLTTRISSGEYEYQASSWLNGLDVANPVDSAMAWASDANSYVCSTVLKPGVAYIQDNDLSGDYYNTCQPVFEVLLARAGYRLAAWLDAIAARAA